MGLPTSILIIPTVFVKSLLRAKLFWFLIVGLILLLWATKFDFQKVWKILKLLGVMGTKVLAVVIHLFLSPFIKVFQETEEMGG